MNTHLAVAVHILVAVESLSRKGNGPVPTEAISWSAKTHKVFILRIVNKLESFGLVKTIRGPHGGIELTKKGKKSTLKDVYLATQEDINVYKIHETNEKCGIGNNIIDVLNDVQNDLDSKLLDEMSKISITDLTIKIILNII